MSALWLHEAFDYVTGVLDNPAGIVRVTGIARFPWRSYGELMEWYHGLRGGNRFGAWSALVPAGMKRCRYPSPG